MLLFYKWSVLAYVAAIYIASLFNSKAKAMIKGRENWQEKLIKSNDKNSKYIWIHCSSAGEFEQGRPLIEKIKTLNQEKKILLSFFSPSGYEMYKNYKYADIICYLPWDTKKNAKIFCNIINIESLILVKYDLWYYHIKEAKKSGAKIFLISGIFRNNHWLFKSGKNFLKSMLNSFNWIFLQDENSKQILNNFDINNCSVTGDTRYDRVIEIAENNFYDNNIESFSENHKVLIAGSTWGKDEKLLANIYDIYKDKLKFIIVPHEVNHAHIQKIKTLFRNSILYSEANPEIARNAQVLIIDKMGLLSKIYRYAFIAYIGGGFGKGIHNTLEAAVYGIPVIFGPNYNKFFEAKQLIEYGAAFSISNKKNLIEILNNLVLYKENYLIASKAAKKHVYSKQGVIIKIYDKIRFISN